MAEFDYTIEDASVRRVEEDRFHVLDRRSVVLKEFPDRASANAFVAARNANRESVRLVVREGCRYGDALPGDIVVVNVEELKNRSTMSACMTEDELKKKAEEKAARAAAKKPKKSQVQQVIEDGLKRISEDAEKIAAHRRAEMEDSLKFKKDLETAPRSRDRA